MKLNKFNISKRYLIFAIVVIIFSAFIVFNETGLIKYIKLKSKYSELQYKTDSLKVNIDKLKAEIDSLKTNEGKIEKIAREKFNMKNPNEKVIKIELK